MVSPYCFSYLNVYYILTDVSPVFLAIFRRWSVLIYFLNFNGSVSYCTRRPLNAQGSNSQSATLAVCCMFVAILAGLFIHFFFLFVFVFFFSLKHKKMRNGNSRNFPKYVAMSFCSQCRNENFLSSKRS